MIREEKKKAHWGKEDLSLSVAKISPNHKCVRYFHLQSSLHLPWACLLAVSGPLAASPGREPRRAVPIHASALHTRTQGSSRVRLLFVRLPPSPLSDLPYERPVEFLGE